ncbi:MAG: alpha/beta hydrolase family protein [Acidobacteriota bacterium]
MFESKWKKLALAAVCAIAPATLCHAQKQLMGDWQGTLTVQGTVVHLLWHVTVAPNGTTTSTFDNVDEGVSGIKAKSLEVKGSEVTSTIDDTIDAGGQEVHVVGTLTGKLNSDASELTGTWQQTEPQEQEGEIDLKRTAPEKPAAAAPPTVAAQPKIAGDWQGKLSAGGAELHIILHIHAAPDGKLSATMDSVDQGAMGIPIDEIKLTGSKLTMTVDAVHGTYDGTVNADTSAIDGTWSQGAPMALNFTRAVKAEAKPEAKPAAPTDADGTWLGTLDLGGMKLRVMFKITNTTDGLKGQMQSPDQGSGWMPVTSVTRKDDVITIDMKTVGATFQGKLSADKQSITGTFTQMENEHPLTMKRLNNEAKMELKRWQNPVKPYPYREEDVSYVSASNTLAGTLTIPPGKGPFPAVLLIAGSGPNNRDEALMGHKPFLVLSDYLTRRGIVVLRMDKRGVGKSKGNYATATTADFADDAQAGVSYLKTRPEVDAQKIGLIGHSEGGEIAPIVATRDRDVAFIVLMAGPGVPGDQILAEQHRLIELAGGTPAAKAAEDNANEKQLLAMVEKGADNAALEKKMRDLSDGKIPEAQIGMQVKMLTSPWFRYFLTYDPATALRQVKCPVLVLNGSLDLQVPPAQNLPAIRKALTEAGNTHSEIVEVPGVNHLFQDAKTGTPGEYGQIEETMSPVVLAKIAVWVGEQ